MITTKKSTAKHILFKLLKEKNIESSQRKPAEETIKMTAEEKKAINFEVYVCKNTEFLKDVDEIDFFR
jgi:hypothetical protein